MAMIRQADRQQRSREALVMNLGDLVREGEEIKSRAMAQAAAIVQEAMAQREKVVAGAREEGHREGLAKGLEEGRRQGAEAGRAAAGEERRAQLSALDKAWSAALKDYIATREANLAEVRRELISMALEIARRVIKRSIEAKPGVAADQLAAALTLLSRPSRLQVLVNPQDEPLVREALPGMSAVLQGCEHVDVKTDAALEPGSCVVRTLGGEIDASIATQLDRIAQALVPSQEASP